MEENKKTYQNKWDESRCLEMLKRIRKKEIHISAEHYLRPDYVSEHLKYFHKVASCIISELAYRKYLKKRGIIGRADGLFISTKEEVDNILLKTKGNPREIEQRLGLIQNSLGNRIYRIDIVNPESQNLRIPSGTESGALVEESRWKPGGLTVGMMREAIIDPAKRQDCLIYKLILN